MNWNNKNWKKKNIKQMSTIKFKIHNMHFFMQRDDNNLQAA